MSEKEMAPVPMAQIKIDNLTAFLPSPVGTDQRGFEWNAPDFPPWDVPVDQIFSDDPAKGAIVKKILLPGSTPPCYLVIKIEIGTQYGSALKTALAEKAKGSKFDSLSVYLPITGFKLMPLEVDNKFGIGPVDIGGT